MIYDYCPCGAPILVYFSAGRATDEMNRTGFMMAMTDTTIV